jgi:hypothetical protein
MFSSWEEYRDYLLEKLITIDDLRGKLAKKFISCDKKLEGTKFETDLYKMEITTIIINDYYFTKLNNFMVEANSVLNAKRNLALRQKDEGYNG